MWRSLGIIAVAVVLTIRTSSVTKSSSESADYFSNFELDDDVELEGQKIAEGVKPNSTFGKDYALMSVSFVNKLQICGGSLIREEWILTSATCLSDPAEGLGYVYIALGRSKKLKFNSTKIILHPDYNAMTHAADIALLKFSPSAISIRRKFKKIMTSTLTFINVADFYVGKILYFCGYGQTKNRPDPDERPPQKFLCTELLVVPSENCSANANIICTRWPQKDNNVCPGDFGGPLYLREGALADVVGLAAWAPPNGANIAQCTDGHYTEHTQLGAYVSWIFDTIAAN